MRFTEWENPETGNLEWLIRKDGCMHCEDPGCLKACPAPGAIVQYSNGIVDFVTRTASAAAIASRAARSTSRASPRSTTRPTSARCAPTASRSARSRPAPRPARPRRIVFGTKDEMKTHADERIEDLKSRGFDQCRPLRSAGRRRHARDVRAAPRRQAGDLRRPARQPEDQPGGRGLEGRDQICRPGRHRPHAAAGFLHHILQGPNRVSEEDEENAERLAGGKS